MPTWTSLGARFWISILGFCEPSSCRTPGAALEKPTNFGDPGEFAEMLDGESMVEDETGKEGRDWDTNELG